MDIGASRQVQSAETSPVAPRAVEQVERTAPGREANGEASSRSDAAATVELSAAAVEVSQEANRAAAAAAAVGLNAVDAARGASEVDATSVTAESGARNENADAAARAATASGGAVNLRIGGAARELASTSSESATVGAAPEEMPGRDVEGASASMDGADPGISEDNLGVVEDAGSPA